MIAQQGRGASREFRKLYVQCMQAVVSYWSGYLLPSDCQLLQFIIDRTLRWGKMEEIITYKQICRGVYGSDGEEYNTGLRTTSRRTIFRAVSRLEENRFISVARTTTTHRGFEANIFAIDCKLILRKDVAALPHLNRRAMIRANKRTPLCQNSTTLVPKDTPPLCQNDTSNIGKGIQPNDNPVKIRATASRFATLEEAVATSTAQTRASRGRKIERAKGGLLYESIIALWKEVMLAKYPTVPPIGFKRTEVRQFKLSLQRFTENVDLREFFTWAVNNWVALRGGKLSWMNIKQELIPLAPSLDVLAKYMKVFGREYANQQVAAHLEEDKQKVTETDRLSLELRQTRAALAESERRRRVERAEAIRRPVAVTPLEEDEAPLSSQQLERARREYNRE